MRRLLTATAAAAAVLIGGPAMGQVDPKVASQCKDARDFLGCVKAFTQPQQQPDDGLGNLRSAMKQVSARITRGFSLRDSTLFFQPLTDQLALVSRQYPDSLAVQNASKSAELFNIVQSAWQSRINSLSVSQYMTTYSCQPTKNGVAAFNAAAGKTAVSYSIKKGWLGISLFCMESVGTGHEAMMLSYIARLLDEGSVSPEEIAERERAVLESKAKAAREVELCKMGPWNRRLEENPKLKEWAKANPSAAKKEMDRYIAKESDKADCTRIELHFGKNFENIENNNNINNIYTKDCSKQPNKDLYTKCITNSK